MTPIDAHAHWGFFDKSDCSIKQLCRYYKELGISQTVVSPLYGMEFDSSGSFIARHFERSSTDWHELFLAEMHASKLDFRALFWIRPHSETYNNSNLELFLRRHVGVMKGLKVHPFHSRMNLLDPRIAPYLELANNLSLVVMVHLAADEFSQPQFMLTAAERYPNATFIMAHLGLHTDHTEAISLLGKRPNLMGDTSWVKPASVIRAAKTASRHLLFGTDAPLGHKDQTWNFYHRMMDELRTHVTQEELDAVASDNARRLFGFEQ